MTHVQRDLEPEASVKGPTWPLKENKQGVHKMNFFVTPGSRVPTFVCIFVDCFASHSQLDNLVMHATLQFMNV